MVECLLCKQKVVGSIPTWSTSLRSAIQQNFAWLRHKQDMKKVIIIHGYTSSPNKKKYQIISEELNKLGAEYSIPALPGEEHPHSQEWLDIIDEVVRNTDKPVILVGHSLGTRAVLLYLDKYEVKVDTVILVATFNNDVEKNRERANGKNYADFFDYPLNIEKVKTLADKFIVVHSRDDSHIDYQQGVEISNELGAELITYEDADHFGGEENSVANAEHFLKVIKSVL